MSGSTIGGFAGAAIGFWFGGPEGARWGFMAGSMIGGAVDPDVIDGPRLTDAQTQTSNEGVPRPIIYGTAAVAGNIIQCGPLVEHKTSERASKGGPVQEKFTYTRDVAIRICEAAPLGGTMRLRRVWKNDKLVYDASGSGAIDAESASFSSILTFYAGDEAQLPDPTLEALPAENGGGVGNVPAYRGSCYAVLTGLDVTETGGAVPQFRWEVASDATVGPDTADYDPLSFDGPTPWNEAANGLTDPRKPGVAYQYAGLHYNTDYNDPDIVWRDTVEEAIADQGALYGVSSIGSPTLVGWTKRFGGLGADLPTSPFEPVTGFEDRYVLGLVFTRYDATVNESLEVFGAGGDELQCNVYATPEFANLVLSNSSGSVLGMNQTLQQATAAPPGYDRTYSCYNGGTYSGSGIAAFSAYTIACRPALGCAHEPPENALPIPDASGYYMVDGEIVDYGTSCTVTAGTFKQLSTLSHGLDGGSLGTAKILSYPLGPVLALNHDDYSNKTFWDAAYADAVAAGTMPDGMTYSATGVGGEGTYPRSSASACLCESSIPAITPGFVALDEIVADLAARSDIGAVDMDLTALVATQVRGFPVARQTSAAEAIRSLQQVYFFDMPEWGNSGDAGTRLRAVLRGGIVAGLITDDDLVDNNDDDATRPQQVEFPRKVNLTASDPESNYEPITQPAERSTENVKAVGEASFSTNVVLTRDEAAVVADKMLKVLWEEALGRMERELPEEFTQFTPADRISYGGKLWRINEVEQMEGTVRWKMARDRASAYQSDATGSTPLTPTSPAATIRGPTIFAAMNLPSLRSADNVPGLYLAAQGLLPGWVGADIYLSTDGGVSEQKVATITDPATMGELAVATDADGGDSTGLITVDILQGGELDSITEAQLAARLNGFAIITDGVAEIGQFQNAAEDGGVARRYDLTNVARGELGTIAAAHNVGNRFVLLDGAVKFLPLDVEHAGKTLIFRAVSIGTAPANNPTTSVVFDPPTFIIDGGGA